MKHKGFTLVEFIVIISIFAIMASVALFNYQGFRSSVSLNNLSHDIALTIRQAQVFGWGTLTQNDAGGNVQLDSVTGNPLRYAEGVYFKKVANGYDSSMILYRKGTSADALSAAFYVPGTGQANDDQVVDTIKIQGPNRIDSIQEGVNQQDLAIAPNGHPVNGTPIAGDFSVAFSRPKQQAYMFDGQNEVGAAGYNYVGIYVAADADCPSVGSCNKLSHVIIISRSGEITVN